MQGAAFPGTLGELVNRLKAWRATLQATVEAATPGPLRLEQLSRKLQVLHCAADHKCLGTLDRGSRVMPSNAAAKQLRLPGQACCSPLSYPLSSATSDFEFLPIYERQSRA